MKPRARKHTRADADGPASTESKICFVVSPIGTPGTDHHTRFKEILEYVIKPGLEASGYALKVVRADDIDRAGSFIKDILEHISGAHIVIADLTTQNPNVFYELGVRHSLSARTILIAQSIDEIPADLRDYRTIVYDATARGVSEFRARIKRFLDEIEKAPDRPDNPVLDRMPEIAGTRTSKLESENSQLRKQLDQLLRSGTQTQGVNVPPKSVKGRVARILKFKNAQHQSFEGSFKRGDVSLVIPAEQGNFKLYFLIDDGKIKEMWYLSVRERSFDPADEIADIRVLIERCNQGQNVSLSFIVAYEEGRPEIDAELRAIYRKMIATIPEEIRGKFWFGVWDEAGLLGYEKKLGLKF